MINILICDDDKTVIDKLSGFIFSWGRKNGAAFAIDTRCSGDFIITDPRYYDLAFIDIEMPGISGLLLSEKLQKINPDIILTVVTSFDEYLDDAMRIHIFRYLSKPINLNRLERILKDAVIEYHKISRLIIIKEKDEIYLEKTKDILYIENLKNGSKIVTKTTEHITNKKPSVWIAEINQPDFFVRSHNSFYINLQNVISFSKTKITMRKNTNETITTYMSQRKYQSFKKAFDDYIGGIK